jgi:hypothetical protein
MLIAILSHILWNKSLSRNIQDKSLFEIMHSPRFEYGPINLGCNALSVFKHLFVEYEKITLRQCNVSWSYIRGKVILRCLQSETGRSRDISHPVESFGPRCSGIEVRFSPKSYCLRWSCHIKLWLILRDSSDRDPTKPGQINGFDPQLDSGSTWLRNWLYSQQMK